jgi:hypothetical protein
MTGTKPSTSSQAKLQPDDTARHDTLAEHGRQRQNRVGKRYRGRLRAGFDNLQAALRMPVDDADDESGHQGAHELPPTDAGGKARKRSRPVNKKKVVELARERVLTLVRDWEAIQAEKDALLRARAFEGW